MDKGKQNPILFLNGAKMFLKLLPKYSPMVPIQVSVSCGFPIKDVVDGDSFENSYQGYQKVVFLTLFY